MPERMSLRLNPVINKYNDYQGVAITPSTVNYGILNDVVDSRIRAKENSIIKQSAIKQSLGQIRQQLHQDEETLSWFDNKSKEVENKIDAALVEGNYNTALNIATQEAGNLASDAELLSRIKANQDYQAKVDETHKRAIAGKISYDTERWWLNNNEFKYENVLDKQGSVIGGTSYDTLSVPVDDIDIADFTKKAFDLITPNKTDNKIVNANGTGTHNTRTWVTRQQISDNLNDILDMTPGAREALYQRYQVEKDKFNKLNKDKNSDDTKINQQNKLMKKNGSNVSFKEFCIRMIEQSAINQNLAYDISSNLTDNQLTKKGSGNGTDTEFEEQDDQPDHAVQGKKYSTENKNSTAKQDSDAAGADAGNMMQG